MFYWFVQMEFHGAPAVFELAVQLRLALNSYSFYIPKYVCNRHAPLPVSPLLNIVSYS